MSSSGRSGRDLLRGRGSAHLAPSFGRLVLDQSRRVGAVTIEAPRVFSFDPNVGRWNLALQRLARTVASGEDPEVAIEVEIQQVVSTAGTKGLSPDASKYAFVLSLLQDVRHAGGQLMVMDSRMYVSWPDWHGPDGRETARFALSQAREEQRSLATEEVSRLRPLYQPDMTPDAMRRFLSVAKFWLVGADEVHPSGVTYSQAFTASLGLWNMPYRGRTGRIRRFLVVGQAEGDVGPVVIGLIELGDDTPYNTERDLLLGLRPADFAEWLQGDPSVAPTLKKRFRSLRKALLPVTDIDFSGSASKIVAAEQNLVAVSAGRSQVESGFIAKKRVAYALRLAHGEEAMARFIRSGAVDSEDRSVREGLRALKDLTVPRITMEVTVCGAVPPFSQVLGGKLVVGFLGHPRIIQATVGSLGTITSQVFDQETLEGLLPDFGLLGLTTKGLYPFHSALYNRAEIPSADEGRPLRLRKIGETRGSTTTLLTKRTSLLSQQVLDASLELRQVSTRYGTGGAKRQRRIEAAVTAAGLPQTLSHAGIRRPVYGVPFASNIGGVLWAGAEPQWLQFKAATEVGYAERATQTWRTRWLDTALRRLEEDTSKILPGTLSAVLGEVNERTA